MQDHALIGNFVGLQPSKKTLVWWINSTWKPKGHYDMHLGSKGFFTISLLNLEDQNRILEGGCIFSTLLASSYDPRRRISTQTKNI